MTAVCVGEDRSVVGGGACRGVFLWVGCCQHVSSLYLSLSLSILQPVASVKPPVVAEWGSGVTPRLDPDTISKHVKQMVDVRTPSYYKIFTIL